ncbi:MAG: hypothetical protein OEM84_06405, partial [Acidimicrobiia bacterium]|nr:hypothetical protein [Acidimicrobiia bacterium]
CLWVSKKPGSVALRSVGETCAEQATTTTTQPSPTITTTVAGQTTEQFGFVRSVTDGTLVFDPADFLTGVEAVAAARARPTSAKTKLVPWVAAGGPDAWRLP